MVPDDPHAPTEQDTTVPTHDSQSIALPEPGYDYGDVIGRGGMGEVVSAHDRRMGRDVAIKRMHRETASDAAVTRFLREARIQARLDHPAIVPVYELGLDAQGRPYFTMKRLAGVTLAQRMAEQMPLTRLLRAFVDVCLAIEFAHTRRVVHRDLKPANIMLGDYGEVYVLDWGIARVLAGPPRPRSEPGDTIDTLDESTKAGDVLGTPGFMAPEQVRGLEIGPAADVYALGAILFELLAGEPLHARGSAALAQTLAGPQQSPAARVPAREIAPELDAACVAALAEDPAARPTAGELGERLQRYLDGDRDHERRRELAAEQLAIARAAFASNDPEQRPIAMRSAGRAVALDPESAEAAQLVTRLLVEPPHPLPAELVTELAAQERSEAIARMSVSVRSLLSFLGLLVLLPWMDVRSWTTFAIAFGSLVATIGALALAAAKRRPSTLLSLVAGLALAYSFSRVIGPFVLTPVVIAGSALAITANRAVFSRPLLVSAWLLAALLVPIGLEAAGVFHETWTMIDGGVCATSAMFQGLSRLDPLMLVFSHLLLLGAVGAYGIRVHRASTKAQQDLHVQAWHLRKLLPR